MRMRLADESGGWQLEASRLDAKGRRRRRETTMSGGVSESFTLSGGHKSAAVAAVRRPLNADFGAVSSRDFPLIATELRIRSTHSIISTKKKKIKEGEYIYLFFFFKKCKEREKK